MSEEQVVETPAATESSKAVLAEARQLGWVPLEEFRGDQSRWVDAEAFVQRGHEIMPLLKANNNRLLEELTTVRGQLKQATEAIEQLQMASAEITKERVAAVRKELVTSIRTAREEGNIEDEDRLTEKLAELKAAERAEPAPKKIEAPVVDPAFTTWAMQPENAWFGKDRRRTSLAMAIAEELRADPANNRLVGVPFYEKVAAEVEATVSPPRPDRVEGSRGGAGGSGSGAGGKGYAALPADARAACDKQGKQFIGKPGFKDAAAWNAYYAKIYFGDQA